MIILLTLDNNTPNTAKTYNEVSEKLKSEGFSVKQTVTNLTKKRWVLLCEKATLTVKDSAFLRRLLFKYNQDFLHIIFDDGKVFEAKNDGNTDFIGHLIEKKTENYFFAVNKTFYSLV